MTTLQFALLLTGWMVMFLFSAHKHFRMCRSNEVRTLDDTILKIFAIEGEQWWITVFNFIVLVLWFVFVPVVLLRAFIIQFIIKDWKP